MIQKYLASAFIWGSFMYNGIEETLPSCIYPIKYLNASLLPYDSLLDNNILLVSALSILIYQTYFY